MTRSPRAAPSLRARYPRLVAAWRILVGAAPLMLGSAARGDASLPPTTASRDDGIAEHGPPVEAQKPIITVKLGGVVAVVEPPQPPRLITAATAHEPPGNPSREGTLAFVDDTLRAQPYQLQLARPAVKLQPAPRATKRKK